MSRLGKRLIPLPKGVEIQHQKGKFLAKGPKGTMEECVPENVTIKTEDSHLQVLYEETKEKPQEMFGLYYSLIKNAILGVSQGFEVKLQLIGVGYRAAVKGNSVDLQLGFSHPMSVPIPEGIQVKVEKSTEITVSGVSKQAVGQMAATIRAKRPPEPYKGKGVRYVGEYVRKKAGKAAKGK